VAGSVAYIALSALSAGAYYAGEDAIGRNPNATKVGEGYVAGLAVTTGISGGIFLLVGLFAPLE
jgi:hypothetical protein